MCHSFYGENIFLTQYTFTPTNNKSIFIFHLPWSIKLSISLLGRNKWNMTKKSCRACWIRLIQGNYILLKKPRFLWVWLNNKSFKLMPFFWPTAATTATSKFWSTLPTLPTSLALKFDPGTHAPMLPTPPTLFSRLFKMMFP